LWLGFMAIRTLVRVSDGKPRHCGKTRRER
jgi:hypothetical protein